MFTGFYCRFMPEDFVVSSYIRGPFTESTPFLPFGVFFFEIISGQGIICGPNLGSFPGYIHLRACTSTVFSIRVENRGVNWEFRQSIV